MFCYVGQATKIFLVVVSIAVSVGLIAGFSVAVKRAGARKAGGCEDAACEDVPVSGAVPVPFGNVPGTFPANAVPNNVPAATAAALPPILSPPSPADSAAAAPSIPIPSSPPALVQGPVQSSTQPSVSLSPQPAQYS